MFHLHVSAYINDRLKKNKMTYRDLAAKSGVPLSTIYGYARGQVNKPDDDALIRIANAFGDGEDVVKKMHDASLPSIAQENMILAASSDQQRMEQLVQLIRKNFVAVMDEYMTAADQQYRERLATVQSQYDKLMTDMDRRYAERIAAENRERLATVQSQYDNIMTDMDRRYAERIAAEKAHYDALSTQMLTHEREMSERSKSSREYLKRLANQRLIIIVIMAVVLFASMSYNIYAYRTFDMADETRGIYRQNSEQ